MAKSALYAVNSADQVVANGGRINFGTPVRRFGCNTNVLDGNLFIVGSGYYAIDTNFTVTGTTAGVVTITLYKDGTPISGAEASVTVVAGDQYAVTIPAMIRQYCNCGAYITAVVSGVGATINNATAYVERI